MEIFREIEKKLKKMDTFHSELPRFSILHYEKEAESVKDKYQRAGKELKQMLQLLSETVSQGGNS